MTESRKSKELQYLLCHHCGQDYAIQAVSVKEILHDVKIHPLPMDNIYIKGIIALRGTVIPVLNLKNIMGETDQNSTSVVICSHDESEFGIELESPKRVINIDNIRIKKVQQANQKDFHGMIKELTHQGEKSILLLDLQCILSQDFAA